MTKDMKKLALEYRAKGWRIEPTNGGHFKWLSPEGFIVFAASTPSDCRAIHAHRALLRRAERTGA